MPTKERVIDFMQFILDNILENPKEAEISAKEDEGGLLLELSVPENEVGKVIGKGGKTAKSMRIILGAIGSKLGQRVYLKILNPEEKE